MELSLPFLAIGSQAQFIEVVQDPPDLYDLDPRLLRELMGSHFSLPDGLNDYRPLGRLVKLDSHATMPDDMKLISAVSFPENTLVGVESHVGGAAF